jgi:hypothetical protein
MTGQKIIKEHQKKLEEEQKFRIEHKERKKENPKAWNYGEYVKNINNKNVENGVEGKKKS